MLTKEDLADFTLKLRHNENPVWNATPAIVESFRKIGRAVDSWNQPRVVSHLVTHLNGLFLNIFDALSTQQLEESPDLTSPRRTIESFLNELKNNPTVCSERWSKSNMDEHCGLGVTTFSKYCRELVNIGAMEFLNRCRLDFAAKMLTQKPSKSITEIAFMCGFNTSQYFATCFRKHFGCTPNEYRQRTMAHAK